MIRNVFQRDERLAAIPHLDLQYDADLKTRTSMQTRSTASVLATVHHPVALRQLLLVAREREWPLLMLGGGTNTIFATRHFEGIVVILGKSMFGEIEHLGDNMVRVGAAAALTGLISYTRKNHLMGLEFCTMIPGTVGGALAGNAGAGNWGLCDFVERAVVMTRSGRVVELRRTEFNFAYRYSELSEGIVLEADLLLEPAKPEYAKQKTKEFADKKKNQPYNVPSSGCVFKNPRDPRSGDSISAGKLIDEAGLKGYELNSVVVSPQHANFLVNKGGASGEDFLAMISLIQDIVHDRTGIMLDVEARIVGGPMTSCILR